MLDLLTPLQTRKKLGTELAADQLVPVSIERQEPENHSFALNSPEDVLQALKSKPDLRTLGRALRWLNSNFGDADDFNVKKPSPKAAQLVFALVNDVVPDYWEILHPKATSGRPKEARQLLQCLSSVAGIGVILSRLRQLLDVLKDPRGRSEVDVIGRTQPLELVISLVEELFAGDSFIIRVWTDINAFISQPSHKQLQWREFVSLMAAGKVLSILSEANAVLRDLSSSIRASSWVDDGNQYALWLGRNIQYMTKALSADDVEGFEALSQFLSKAFNLGYTDQIVHMSFCDLIGGDYGLLNRVKLLEAKLPAHENKTFLYSIVRTLAKRLPNGNSNEIDNRMLGGAAALIAALIHGVSSSQDSLVGWLVGINAGAVGQTHCAHRAVIAALCSDTTQATRAMQKSLDLFGDKLYIKHTPILHQEVLAQISLMLISYVSRVDKMALIHLSRSSVYLNAVSNRLAASSPRARFLGMVYGTAMSELVDPQDKRMTFSAEEMNSSEGRWYKSLTSVNDPIGSIEDLKHTLALSINAGTKTTKLASSNGKSTKSTGPANKKSKILSIKEIVDNSESETEELPMYEKPDSDPSDEDEDPTIVQRNRTVAPVYVRDLIAGLRDGENFERHKLALSTASSLIRRKAAFGIEVLDNIEDLANILVGLGDNWEMANFQQMRLQGMIAVLTAEPVKMGQWFSRTFYSGDYSMGQRASVLTALGLGARELAGLGQEDAALTGANGIADDPFPSKRLPAKLEKVYALEAAPMNALFNQLEKAMIQPMAAEVADKFSGPNALKVRTFSSRMAVEKKRRKPILNALAKIVADGFFFPLTGRWRVHLQSYGESTSHTSPFLLSHFLKTVSLILHASGTSTLSLPQMTSEFWDLLLSLRPRATDPSVLEALLFAFLTLLDINENDQRSLAEQHAKELLETQQWVENVFDLVGGGSEEGERIRMLASGVLLRARAVVEKQQWILMGDLVDFI